MVSLLAAAVLALGFTAPGVESAKWEASYGKALEATKAVEHPLLVVLDKPAASDARVAPELLSPSEDAAKEAELLKSYQLCHVDVTSEYGQKVAEAFGAKAFPFVAVIDKTGSVIIFSKSGKIASDEWSKMLTTYKAGDRSLATVSRTSFKIVSPGSSSSSYCPSCQQRSF